MNRMKLSCVLRNENAFNCRTKTKMCKEKENMQNEEENQNRFLTHFQKR